MPTLDHSLGELNPRNSLRRQVRAQKVMERVPVELAGCIVGLRKVRVGLEKTFHVAQSTGDAVAASRVADTLLRIADTLHRIAREPRRSKRSFPVYDLPSLLLESSIPDADTPQAREARA